MRAYRPERRKIIGVKKDNVELDQTISINWHKFTKTMVMLWERWLRHFLMFVLLFCYTTAGAAMFVKFEAPNETDFIRNIWQQRDKFMHHIRTRTKAPEMTFEKWQDELIEGFRRQKRELCTTQTWLTEDKYIAQWTYGNAVRFCSSVFFVIGAGDMYPITRQGRILCLFYGMFGIPFVLYCLKFYARLFSKLIHLIGTQYLRFYHTGKIFRLKLSSTPPANLARNIMWTLDTMTISFGGRPSRTEFEENFKKEWIEPKKSDIYEMPFLVALLFVCLFICITGFLIYRYIESWTIVEALYYLFIVLFTIGFGDYVITNTVYVIAIHIALFIGFVMMTTLIGSIQSNVIRMALQRKHAG